jgi:hypothetical protein
MIIVVSDPGVRVWPSFAAVITQKAPISYVIEGIIQIKDRDREEKIKANPACSIKPFRLGHEAPGVATEYGGGEYLKGSRGLSNCSSTDLVLLVFVLIGLATEGGRRGGTIGAGSGSLTGPRCCPEPRIGCS